MRIADKRRREGRSLPAYVPAIGTRRRTQALACLGYSAIAISAGCCSEAQIKAIRSGGSETVIRRIAAHVLEFYRNHADRPLGKTLSACQLRALARRNNYAPPLAWDDTTIDRPDAQPQHLVKDSGLASDNEEFVDLDQLLAGRSHLNTGSAQGFTARRHKLNMQAIRTLERRGLNAAEIGDRVKLTVRTVERYRARMAVRVSEDTSPSTTTAGTTPSASTSERHHAA